MVGQITYESEQELNEIKQILFGTTDIILINEHIVNGVLDLTEENVIVL